MNFHRDLPTAKGSDMPRLHFLAITLGFNLYWLLAVWGQFDYIWLLIVMLIGCWWTFRGSWRFAIIAGITGISMDMLLSYFGVYQFAGNALPLWLILLWLGFSSFVWLVRKVIQNYPPYVLVIIGSIGGMISYWAGFRLEAVSWPLGIPVTVIILLVAWLVYFMILLVLLKKCIHRWEG
ncbi:DUF2878 domain-containing protein [Photobacterium sp.]|uniref:DUF2878 domain-containing protein n=1 Tax=Photobacterium sp. TaxID=660 RepID=UPI00299D6172|nr:DUF2878 domain-containing protein [Photobacterium sp.]MDX1301444.1 DUF2878 domain-containing protein [Photobacterium sp.]